MQYLPKMNKWENDSISMANRRKTHQGKTAFIHQNKCLTVNGIKGRQTPGGHSITNTVSIVS